MNKSQIANTARIADIAQLSVKSEPMAILAIPAILAIS
jgi:hypothetical protein